MLQVDSHTARSDGTGPRMQLVATGDQATCDADVPACEVPAGESFVVSIEVVEPPAEGYVGFQTEFFYGGLTYQPRALDTEIVWAQSALAARFPAQPAGGERLVAHGDASAGAPPFPASAHTGSVVELLLACPEAPGAHTVALLPYAASGRPLGAGFRAAGMDGSAGAAVPVKTSDQRDLDLDGDSAAESVPVADAVDIECVPNLTPTPTITSTPTPTPTRTRTATPRPRFGDVDCTGIVSSIDAALVLQLAAGLLEALACPQNGDVDRSGETDSIDATLILQFSAGLIPALPPS